MDVLLVMIYVDVCCAVVSVTCWGIADLLAVMFVVFCHFPKCVLLHICRETGLSPTVKY